MVEKVVSSQVANLSLKQRLTLIELEQIFHDIRVALEDELSRQPNGFLANVMLPPQHSSGVIIFSLQNIGSPCVNYLLCIYFD